MCGGKNTLSIMGCGCISLRALKGGPPPGFEETATAERIPGDVGETGGQKQFSSRAPVSCVREELGRVGGQGLISGRFDTQWLRKRSS